MSRHDSGGVFYTDPDTGETYRWNKLTLSWDAVPQGGRASTDCGTILSGLFLLGLVAYELVKWIVSLF